MNDNDFENIFSVDDLLDLVKVIEDNLDKLYIDGKFYEESKYGERHEVSILPIIKDNSKKAGSPPAASHAYELVICSSESSFEHNNINAIEYFKSNIENKYRALIKNTLYENYEHIFIKKLKNILETNKNVYVQLMLIEYVKSYKYVMSTLAVGKTITVDTIKNKIILEEKLKTLIDEKSNDYLSVTQNNLAENIEIILSAILNNVEYLTLINNRVFWNTNDVSEELELVHNLLLDKDVSEKDDAKSKVNISIDKIRNLKNLINEMQSFKNEIGSLESNIFSKYEFENTLKIQEKVLKEYILKYKEVTVAMFKEMNTDQLFKYILLNQIKDLYLFEIKSDEDLPDDIGVNNNNIQLDYLTIYMLAIVDRLEEFNEKFLENKPANEKIDFINKLMDMTSLDEDFSYTLTSKEEKNVNQKIHFCILNVMREIILSFNEKKKTNSFGENDVVCEKEIFEFYKAIFYKDESVYNRVMAELSLLENLTFDEGVSSRYVHHIVVNKSFFETVFPKAQLFLRKENRDYGYSSEPLSHDELFLVNFSNFKLIIGEENIEFLIPLEQKYAKFFDINEVFRKVKYTLDMERNNTIISLFDEIIDEQIVSAKFKLIDDEKGENAQSKKESVRKKI